MFSYKKVNFLILTEEPDHCDVYPEPGRNVRELGTADGAWLENGVIQKTYIDKSASHDTEGEQLENRAIQTPEAEIIAVMGNRVVNSNS